MTDFNLRNIRICGENRYLVTVDLKIDGKIEAVEYCAFKDDIEETGRMIYQAIEEMADKSGFVSLADYQASLPKPDYRQLRLAEYPPLGEFADAFVKLQSGDHMQMDQYVADCLAVKEKHPKPII